MRACSAVCLGLLLLVLGSATAQPAVQTDMTLLVPEGELANLLERHRTESALGVESVAFSPDGKTLATGSKDDTATLWRLSPEGGAQPLAKLQGHAGVVMSVAFSPDGKTLATGSGDYSVRLWKLGPEGDAELVAELKGHAGAVTSVAFSPDGKTLATGSWDNTARLWKLSPKDGAQLLAELKGHAEVVTSVVFSPDGKTLATGSRDNMARLWKLRLPGKTELVAELKGHANRVDSVAFSPDGQTLATGSSDHTAKLWRLSPEGGAQLLAELEGHADRVASVAFSPDGKILATGSWDKSVRLWRLSPESGAQPLAELKGHASPITSVAFSSDGKTLATGSWDDTARLWRLSSESSTQLLAELKSHADRVDSVAFSPDGKTLAALSLNDTVRLWRLSPEGGAQFAELKGFAGRVTSVAFSPDGKTLATGSRDNTTRLWRLSPEGGAQLLAELKGHLDRITSVAFSPDGKTLATGSWDNTVRLWRLSPEGGIQLLAELKGHALGVTAVGFSPNGTTLATGSLDRMVRLWRLSTRGGAQLLAELKGHASSITSVAFSPDGKILATGSRDNTARLWRLSPEGSAQVLTGLNGHEGLVTSMAFSPDGKILATGFLDNTLRLWRLNAEGRAQLLARLKDGGADFTSVVFSHDGKSLITASYDGRVRLWSDGQRIGQMWHTGQGWVGQHRDRLFRHDTGSILLTTQPDGTLAPIPPPRPVVEPQLSMELLPEQTKPALDAGAAGRLVVRVHNAPGAGRAYWLRLEGQQVPEGVVLKPERTHLRLEPGESTDIPVALYVLSGKMEKFRTEAEDEREQPVPTPRSQVQITLALSHAFGRSPVLHARFDWHAPKLQGAFKLTGGITSSAVEVRVSNEGNQDPKAVTVEARFVDAQGCEHPVEGRQQFDAGALAPGKSVTFSLAVPDALRKKLRLHTQPLRVKLLIRDGLWYTHLWRPLSEPLRPALFLWATAGVLLVALAALGVLLRLYLDPVVRATAREAAAIRHFPLAALPRVGRALSRVRRLDGTLDAAGLSRARWERASAVTRSPYDSARALAESLGATLREPIEPGLPAFPLELPPLGLRFAQHSAVWIMIGRELEPGAAARMAEALDQGGRGPRVVLAIDRTERQNAQDVLRSVPRLAFVVLSADAFRDLLLHDQPRQKLAEAIVAQRPVVSLSPYKRGGGVTDSALFFGRAAELRQIADERLHNVLLVGPRQMGKSTLLHALERRIRARGDVEVQHHTLISGDVIEFLASKLGRPRPTGESALYELLAGTKDRPRLWLLDEADGMVRAEKESGQLLSRTMRALAEDGRAFFVLAGFWQLYAAVALDPNSPLRNFGRTLRLGPLDRDAARELATVPMDKLHLHYDAPETVEHLLEQTGCRANLVALACSGLIERLGPTERTFTRAHLDAVLQTDKELRDALVFWRGSSGGEGLRNDGISDADRALDRAILRAALLSLRVGARPTRSELRTRLDATGLRPSGDMFQRSLDRAELCYLLIRDDQDRYFCPIPLIQRAVEREQPLEEGLREDVEDFLQAQRE